MVADPSLKMAYFSSALQIKIFIGLMQSSRKSFAGYTFLISIYSIMYYDQILMFCFSHFLLRHTLACLHFNENVHRETQTSKDGKKYTTVWWPKFRPGEEVVKEVAVPPTYSKCFSFSCISHNS